MNSIEFDTNVPLKKRDVDTRKEFLICEVCIYLQLTHIYYYTIHLMRKDFHERPSPSPERQVLGSMVCMYLPNFLIISKVTRAGARTPKFPQPHYGDF